MHPEDGRVISNFIMQALRNEDITIYGDGEQTRSFQYVDDLINVIIAYMEKDCDELYAACSSHGFDTPVINTGNPDEFTIKELAESVLKLIPESSSKLIFEPLPKDDPTRRKPDITLAKEILDWEPEVPLEQGLIKAIAYFRTCV
jgi:UDP-glucuronate decarboxylase